MPEDTEELALTLNGKKRKLKKTDFIISMQACGLETKVIENIFLKFLKAETLWREFIYNSFLPIDMQNQYINIIHHKLELINNETF